MSKIGNKYGDLEVLSLDHMGKNYQSIYRCRCVCGAEKLINSTNLLYGRTKSCGCKSLRYRKSLNNESFFEIPSIINSYWAGFLAADGCIMKNKPNVVSLGMSIKDEKHLKAFIRDLGINNGITYIPSHSACSIAFSSGKVVKDLFDNFNITPRKSLTLIPPNILNQGLINSFIVGYIDGDGSIGKTGLYEYTYLQIVGTQKVLQWIVDNLRTIGNLSKVPKIGINRGIGYFSMSGSKTDKVLSHLLRYDVPRLDRKWNLVKERNKDD